MIYVFIKIINYSIRYCNLRFLVRLDDTIDLSTELTRFQEISKVSNIEHVQIIRRSLCDAYNSRALAKKDSLLKQGKLQVNEFS